MAKISRDKRRGYWICSSKRDNFVVDFTKSYFMIIRRAPNMQRESEDDDLCRKDSSRYYYAEFNSMDDIITVIEQDQLLTTGRKTVANTVREFQEQITKYINGRKAICSNISDRAYNVKWNEPRKGTELNGKLKINNAGIWIEYPVIDYQNIGGRDTIVTYTMDTFYVQFSWFNRTVVNDSPDGYNYKYVTVKKTEDGITAIKTVDDWISGYFPGNNVQFILDDASVSECLSISEISKMITDSFTIARV